MKHKPIQLPFNYKELEPHISAKTVEIHYGKHHQGYVDKLNKTKYGDDNNKIALKDIILNEEGDVFQLAAQVWNHDFYWENISPKGGGNPSDKFTPVLSHHFGSLDRCKKDLFDAAKGEFGSGWAWLVMDSDNNFKVLSSTDAQNPLLDNMTPLLTIDVWEHAYYLDYTNERSRYIQNFIDHLIDWKVVESRYQSAIHDEIINF